MLSLRSRPEIPTKPALQFILSKVSGRWKPLMLVATFCGLRGSDFAAWVCWMLTYRLGKSASRNARTRRTKSAS
jgi:hypothetical protein